MKNAHYYFTTSIGAIVTILVFNLTFIGSVKASTVSLLASSDTYITEHAGLGGPESVHGSDDRLWLARGTGVFREIPLIKFDLTAYENRIVSGSSAEFRLELNSGNGNNPLPSQSVSIRETLVDWSEDTTSFSNFGGTGYNEAIQTGSNLITRDVTYTGVTESILFTIPSYIVQGWIDDSATNYGLIVISNTTENVTDLTFSSREGLVAPSLTFSLTPVPIPSALLLFGSGMLGFLGMGKIKYKTSKISG